jgi:adenosylhomocysteine nucleosidase
LNEVGIVAALAAESRVLGPATRRAHSLASLADGTLLSVSGMGRAAAGEGARRLVEAGARALVSFGLAGGLDPALVAGTLVLPSQVVSPDGRRFVTSPEWCATLRAALAASQPVCAGTLLTCDTPIGCAADKARAFRDTGAAAVDMESLAVAEVASGRQLPFVAVRAIVDTADDALPAVVLEAAADGGALRIGQLLGSLARTPADFPRLVRLAHAYRAARRTLALVAGSGALAGRSGHGAARAVHP